MSILEKPVGTGTSRVVQSPGPMDRAATPPKSANPASQSGPLRVLTPRMLDAAALSGGWSEAFQLAQSQIEPVFLQIVPFADDRGWSYMNLLNGVMSDQGQINYSVQYPGVVKAWHRHDRQTDFWICLQGHLKVGAYRDADHTAWMIVAGEKRPGVLIIPPPLWHGAACVGPEPAGLLYYVTQTYDHEQPDEHRRAWDSVPGFPWAARNG